MSKGHLTLTGRALKLYGYLSDIEGVGVFARAPTTLIDIAHDMFTFQRPVGEQVGPIIPGTAPPVADPYDCVNKVNGITHRIGRAKPAVIQPVRAVLEAHCRPIVRELFGEIKVQPLEFDEWLDGTNYTASRRNTLRRIHELFRDYPDATSKCIINAFVKREKFVAFKNARLICSRDDVCKCVFGPIFKALEKHVFENSPGSARFIKHVPVRERASYVTDMFEGVTRDWRIFSNDHTSFETHAHTTFPQFEFIVYQELIPDEHVVAILRALGGAQKLLLPANEIETIGRASVQSRNSGEMNTSLGNGLANLLSVLTLTSIRHGDLWRAVRTIIEGDDGIFAFPPGVVVTPGNFRAAGFVVVMEEAETVGRAGFCSTYFLEDGSAGIVEPMKQILGLGWSLRVPTSAEDSAELMRSKSLAVFIEYPGVPILSALGDRLLSEYGMPKGDPDGDWYDRQLFKWAKDHPEVVDRTVKRTTRHLFEETFGWSESEQISVEENIMKAPIADILNHASLISRAPDDYATMYAKYTE